MKSAFFQPTYNLKEIDAKDINTLIQINNEILGVEKYLPYGLGGAVAFCTLVSVYGNPFLLPVTIGAFLYCAHEIGKIGEAGKRWSLKEFLAQLDSEIATARRIQTEIPENKQHDDKVLSLLAKKELIEKLAIQIKFDPNLSFNSFIKLFTDENARRNPSVSENAASAGLSLNAKAD